jgi:hydroxymethylpyrimidine/phosphomethylpyrimidine kinase
MRPTVLSVAGSDSSGGAGLQADLKAIEASGGYAATVVTAVTAQNTRGVVRSEPLGGSLVRDQLEAVFGDLHVRAVKSGMLGEAASVHELAAALRRHRAEHYVCDPVLRASSGHELLGTAAREAMVRELFPLAEVLTPNVEEAQRLTGVAVRSARDAEQAARKLLESGCGAVLVKGGHLAEQPGLDLLVDASGCTEFRGEFVQATHDHGTGCILASAVATHLALGRGLHDAVRRAKALVVEAVRHGLGLGGGRGPADALFAWQGRGGLVGSALPGRLHVITDQTLQQRHSHAVLAQMALDGGADTVQYRDKRDVPTAERVAVARELKRLVAGRGARLVVNDRVDVALAVSGDVHLGPKDLAPDEARRLMGDAALIGATAHGLEQALRLADAPVDYVGLGPVFGTTSKADPAPPLGLAEFARIAARLYKPVIAIGGVTPERVRPLLEHGAYGVAVLSSVVCQEDPRSATRLLLREIQAGLPAGASGPPARLSGRP